MKTLKTTPPLGWSKVREGLCPDYHCHLGLVPDLGPDLPPDLGRQSWGLGPEGLQEAEADIKAGDWGFEVKAEELKQKAAFP